MRYEVMLDEQRVRVDVGPDGRFTVDDQALAADVREVVRGRVWSIRVNGESHEVTLLTLGDQVRLDVDGVEVRATALDERALRARRGAARTAAGCLELRAPMPGLLKAVHVREGDAVVKDAPLATLEAMKMENELRAPSSGRVTRIAVAAGTKVEGGALLVVIAAE